MPRRLATPGRNPSSTTSAWRASRRTTSPAAGFLRSRQRLRLLRFSVSNWTGTYARPGSPFGISILITSAPRSDRIAEANGPGTNIEKSTTRTPASGSQGSAGSLKVRRRVGDKDFRALARDGEDVQHARGEKAGVARPHLEALRPHLHVRAAFDEIAHLLDAGMQVRVGTFAFLDLAENHLHLARADRFRADQAVIARAAVVGWRIRLHVGLANEIGHGSIQLCSAMPPSTATVAPVT